MSTETKNLRPSVPSPRTLYISVDILHNKIIKHQYKLLKPLLELKVSKKNKAVPLHDMEELGGEEV
jgi:hypothetical protein